MSRVRKGEAGQCLCRVGGARNTVDGSESDMESSKVEVCSVSVLQTESQVNGHSGDSGSNKNHWKMRWC
ncbi:hypothetical protein BDR05DRAFT_960061 [Suillus weaverae]|nr:hypothetical protein BDR05DRAFT_960061 [Suillus weaverae]